MTAWTVRILRQVGHEMSHIFKTEAIARDFYRGLAERLQLPVNETPRFVEFTEDDGIITLVYLQDIRHILLQPMRQAAWMTEAVLELSVNQKKLEYEVIRKATE